MKNLIVVLVASFALFVSSCSDMNESYNPISPNVSLNKGSGELSPDAGRYDYLEIFSVYKLESWVENSGRIVIQAPALPPNVKEIYCEIVYEESSDLYYLQRPNFNAEVFVDVTLHDKVTDVRLYSYCVDSEISGAEYSYEDLQSFDALPLDNWMVNHDIIEIYSGGWSPALEDVFLVCEYAGSAPKLVYVGLPDSEVFSVSGLQTKYLEGISLYGFNNIPYGDVQN